MVHSDGMGKIAQNIPTMAAVVLEKAPVLLPFPALRMLMMETCKIEAILPENILEREAELLKYAFFNMPKLIVGEGDVLVVDKIGKNFSGTGVDPNITGTFSTEFAKGGIQVQRTCFFESQQGVPWKRSGLWSCKRYYKQDFLRKWILKKCIQTALQVQYWLLPVFLV